MNKPCVLEVLTGGIYIVWKLLSVLLVKQNEEVGEEVFGYVVQGQVSSRAGGEYSRESSLLHNLAAATVVAGVAVAGVYLGLTLGAVEAGRAGARVLLIGTWCARGTVLTRVRVAHVTLGQNLTPHGPCGGGGAPTGSDAT